MPGIPSASIDPRHRAETDVPEHGLAMLRGGALECEVPQAFRLGEVRAVARGLEEEDAGFHACLVAEAFAMLRERRVGRGGITAREEGPAGSGEDEHVGSSGLAGRREGLVEERSSALRIVAPAAESGRIAHESAGKLSFRRSLALTPAGEDDGFLAALEVFRMKVPADLAVLGACETGKGAARALREAQAHVKSQEKWRHPRYWAAWALWGLPE